MRSRISKSAFFNLSDNKKFTARIWQSLNRLSFFPGMNLLRQQRKVHRQIGTEKKAGTFNFRPIRWTTLRWHFYVKPYKKVEIYSQSLFLRNETESIFNAHQFFKVNLTRWALWSREKNISKWRRNLCSELFSTIWKLIWILCMRKLRKCLEVANGYAHVYFDKWIWKFTICL